MTEDKNIKRKRSHKSYWKLRLEAMQKLGGECAKCGETDIRVLQIAHKGTKPLGNTYKRNKERNVGTNLFKRVISGEVSNEVELLCSNCNILYEFEVGRRHFPEELPADNIELACKIVGKYQRSPKIEDPVVIACTKETKQRMIVMFGKEGTWNDVVNKMLDEFEQLGGKINVENKVE